MTPNELYQKTFSEGKTLKMIPITYEELVNTMLAGKLIPGMQYRITDYVTKVKGEVYDTDIEIRSAGHPFDIIVTAVSEDTLSENCRAARNSNDNNVFATSKLENWELKYTVDAYGYHNACLGPAEIYVQIPDWQGELDDRNLTFFGFWPVNGVKRAIFTLWEDDFYFSNVLYPKAGDILQSCYVQVQGIFITNEHSTENYAIMVEVSEDEEGKGYIYEMLDDHGNRSNYDIKNVQFNDNGTYRYSFEMSINDSDKVDATSQYYGLVRNNTITHWEYESCIPYIKVDCGDIRSNSTYEGNTLRVEKFVANTECTKSTFVRRCNISGMYIRESYVEDATILTGSLEKSTLIAENSEVNLDNFRLATIEIIRGGLQNFNLSPNITNGIPAGVVVNIDVPIHGPIQGELLGVSATMGIVHYTYNYQTETWEPVN